ncbi:MAG TPA: glycoside hydrolase family 44 protein [Thermoanaerobaculaceae bacterium]|nr:glycoside hydrolase family 44 protein [Thermoanaerobaculaceae bacterium]
MRTGRAVTALCAAAALLVPLAAAGASDLPVFADALGSGWANWSWDTTVNLGATSPVHSGTDSLAVTFTAAWGGLYLHSGSNLDGNAYTTLRFFVHGGAAGGQKLWVVLYDGSGNAGPGVAVSPVAGTWTEVDVPIASLGSPAAISGIVWQDTSGGAQPTFYLDDVTLVAATGPPPTPTPTPPPGAGPAIAVDTGAGLHAISPGIYGMNYADETLAADLRLPVRRWGGNSTSRFNWQNDMTNTGSDWYFENVPQDPGSADAFVDQDRRTGTATLMTVPLIGWTAKRRLTSHPYDCGFKVSKYGAQQSTDSWDSDCGNGLHSDGSDLTGNDPTDTSVAIDPSFVQSWVAHLVGKYGTAAAGGVPYYDLDNEPMLWSDTHRDVHPQPNSYDEMKDRTWAYAAAVKAADPTAATLGPAEWGWTGYFWSALDWAAGGAWWDSPPDRLAHGDVPFVEWYLQQMRAYEQQHGVRILDYLDEHFYPPTVALASAGNSATQALRLRSTRLLWDTTYSEESWIAQPVYMIPRMHGWVDANYPGTRLAISEYNWGALDSINGALAQADVLGIFGREGLDLATLWGPPNFGDPGAFAFRIYRNADGAGHGFGESGVSAASADQGRLSAYAAIRAWDGALTIVVVNKTGGGLTSTISIGTFWPAANAHVYCYSAANLGAIVQAADVPVAARAITTTFPASSITLLVVPPVPGPTPTPHPDAPRRRLRPGAP